MSVIHAAHRAEALRRGHLPQAVPTPIVLEPGEGAYERLGTVVDHFSGAGVPYSGLPARRRLRQRPRSLRRRLSDLRRLSAATRPSCRSPQWRPVDQGELVITNKRLVVRGNQGFSEYWYPAIQSAEQDPAGMVLWARDMPTTRLRVDAPEWLAVAYAWSAFGVIAELPLDDDQHNEVERRLQPPADDHQ